MNRASIASMAMLLAATTTAVAEDVRRVVTGLDENNHSVVQFDSRVALTPGKPSLPLLCEGGVSRQRQRPGGRAVMVASSIRLPHSRLPAERTSRPR